MNLTGSVNSHITAPAFISAFAKDTGIIGGAPRIIRIDNQGLAVQYISIGDNNGPYSMKPRESSASPAIYLRSSLQFHKLHYATLACSRKVEVSCFCKVGMSHSPCLMVWEIADGT
ncbi:hypothetical protein ACCT20_18555, partial [Rhizobium ruizarguesonis]